MRDEGGFLLCARCGDRIGVYEPHVWALPTEGASRDALEVEELEWQPLHRDCREEHPKGSRE